jgi:hypothetical protein
MTEKLNLPTMTKVGWKNSKMHLFKHYQEAYRSMPHPFCW